MLRLSIPVLTGNMLGVALLYAASPQHLRSDISPTCALEIDVRTDAAVACWRLKCSAERTRKLGCDFSAMHQIDSVLIAPSGKYIAVLSVGEGHPILEIVALTPLLKSGKFAVKCEVNPYPGAILLGNWSNDKLIVQTDVDLALKDIEQRASSIGESMRAYHIDPARCLLKSAPKSER